VKHRSPKRRLPRFVKYNHPRLGIWTQGYNSRGSITIEKIDIIISSNPKFDPTKRPSEKKEPPPPHMETIDGEDNASILYEEADTDTGDRRGYIVLYGQEKP
jgi:hypothetical protein